MRGYSSLAAELYHLWGDVNACEKRWPSRLLVNTARFQLLIVYGNSIRLLRFVNKCYVSFAVLLWVCRRTQDGEEEIQWVGSFDPLLIWSASPLGAASQLLATLDPKVSAVTFGSGGACRSLPKSAAIPLLTWRELSSSRISSIS